MMKQTDILTKVNTILDRSVINTKKALATELDITRPTLDSRMSGRSDWKKLEVKWINYIYSQLK